MCWRFNRDGKGRWTKVPNSAETCRNASSTDSSTWSDLVTAWGAYESGSGRYDGLGFMLGDGWAGIDLDDSRDPETGTLLPWAENVVKCFDSFADVSPTGTGVKIHLHGELADRSRHIDPVEVYDRDRYFAVCGVPANGCLYVVNERTELLGEFYDTVVKQDKEAKEQARKEETSGGGRDNHATEEPGPTNLFDDYVIDLASRAKNADKFRRFLTGDTSENDGDDSDADSALCCILAFYTRDTAQIDRLIRRSGLIREKWERSDYRQNTIARALDLVGETYKANRIRVAKAKESKFPTCDDAIEGVAVMRK